MHRRSHLPLPAPSLWAPDLFDEGRVENLRAFMLVTSIKDICAEEEFSYYPADVEQDASTAAQIIESGFRLSLCQGQRPGQCHPCGHRYGLCAHLSGDR